MPIPALLSTGLLPPGVHDASMKETQATFGVGNDRRIELFTKLESLIALAKIFDVFTRLYVDGSFVTDKPDPGDIDSSLEMKAADLGKFAIHPRRLELLDRRSVKERFSVDLFMQHDMQFGKQGCMTSFFQKVKSAEAIARKVAPATERGIIVVKL